MSVFSVTGGRYSEWPSDLFRYVDVQRLKAKDDLPDGDEIPEPPKTDPIPEDEVPADVPEPEGDTDGS